MFSGWIGSSYRTWQKCSLGHTNTTGEKNVDPIKPKTGSGKKLKKINEKSWLIVIKIIVHPNFGILCYNLKKIRQAISDGPQ